MSVQPSMPHEVQRAYEIWRLAGRRNYAETGRLCGVPRSTVHAWGERYRWFEQAVVDDADGRRDAIASAEARALVDLQLCDEVRRAALRSRIGADGKPSPGTPTMQAIRTMFGIYDRIGFSPQRRVAIDVTHASHPIAVSDDDLDALDVESLLALASGRPLPPRADAEPPAATTLPDSPPPTDFTSGRLGGRAVPGPTFPETEDAVFDAEFYDLQPLHDDHEHHADDREAE